MGRVGKFISFLLSSVNCKFHKHNVNIRTFVFSYAKELVTVTYTKYNIILLNIEGAISKIIPLVEEFSTFYFEVGGTLNFVNRFF